MHRRLVLAGLAALLSSLSFADAGEELAVIATATMNLVEPGTSVDVSQAAGAYRGIRVRAKKGDVDITRVQVIYGDGSVHNEDRTIRLKAGERTRAIDLSPRDRFIDRISISNKPATGTATIDILGVQTAEGARVSRPSAATGALSAPAADPGPDAGATSPLQGEGEVMFGYQNVGFGIDRDIIEVGGEVGKFDRIRLRVLGNDIHIKALNVVYMDGETQNLSIDATIRANTRTDWFEVKGNRFIRRIELLYRSRPSLRGRARIEVTGHFAEGWLDTGGEGRKFNEGWALLGAQTAGFMGFDTHITAVGEDEGGFTRLRIAVKDRAITLREIRVKYYSGPDEVFAMNERVDPGKPYGPLEFKSGRAAIKAIVAKFRPRFDILEGLRNLTDGSPAVVEIWAQN